MHGNGNDQITNDVIEQVAALDVEDGREPNPSAAAFAAWNNEPPPAPTLKSDGVIATDITEAFTHAAQPVELDVGQLVKDELFTLFEAVGALENLVRRWTTTMISRNRYFLRRLWLGIWDIHWGKPFSRVYT
ncbi:hypothetical protein M7I_5374 [Glarea lozoyensis 74030]|uniref:Uncharacterized protein n=1 Tax=Glarea lozoyensis (strain ATCC 74030 / MF5533) TaxID=1104152 RepID=H0ERQ3_GLAL7|nr:hypothetical protein M7I_5374 [Glarea lozoyensis 74030]